MCDIPCPDLKAISWWTKVDMIHCFSTASAHTQQTILHTALRYNHNSTVFVDLTSSWGRGRVPRCYLSARPRLPTRPSLRVSLFRFNAKLCEGKSTSISHAFLLRLGRESTPLSFDEQGWGCVILEWKAQFLGRGLWQAVTFSSKVETYTHMHTRRLLPLTKNGIRNWIFLNKLILRVVALITVYSGSIDI